MPRWKLSSKYIVSFARATVTCECAARTSYIHVVPALPAPMTQNVTRGASTDIGELRRGLCRHADPGHFDEPLRGLRAVLGLGDRARFVRERAREPRVIEDGGHRVGKPARIERIDEQPGASVIDELWDAADVRADDRYADSHCFDQADRETVLVAVGVHLAREHEQRGRLVSRQDVVPRQGTAEGDQVTDAEPLCCRLELSAERPVTDELAADPTPFADEHRDSPEQRVLALLLHEPSDTQDEWGSRGLRRPALEATEVDAVRNDLHTVRE